VNLRAFIDALRADLAAPGRTWTARGGVEMIVIPAGEVRLGPARRRATLSAFSIARHPVTFRSFQHFVAETGYTGAAGNRPLLGGSVPSDVLDHPAVDVSWRDAQAWCAWAGLVLPTGPMWERAARGTDGRTYPWGEHRPTNALARISAQGTLPVGSFPAVRTATGCEDMVGNISEWCHPGDNPGAPLDVEARHCVVRGSAYLRYPNRQRMACAHQRRLSPDRRNRWVGFRPATLRLGPGDG